MGYNAPPRVKRTAAGLRDALFDEIDELRGENSDPERAKAVAKLAQQIINATRAEIEFHRELNKDTQLCDDFMTGSLNLGAKSAESAKHRVMDQSNGSAQMPDDQKKS